MTCFNPKLAILEPFQKINEKTGEIYQTKRCIFVNHEIEKTPENEKYWLIPCGKCEGCQIAKANDWATRAYLELKTAKNAWFLTITYNNENIPKNRSLQKKDLQNFWKRIRNHQDNIRYLACGEYGPKTARPHYHAIVFNLKITDLKTYKQQHTKDMLFTSKNLEKIWGKGYIIIGQCTYESAAYVARYVTKKAYGADKKFWISKKREPEFTLSSRRPGLADNIRNTKLWESIKMNNGVLVKTKNGVVKKPIPAFLRKKWKDLENRKEYFEKLEINHKNQCLNFNKEKENSSLNFWQRLKQRTETLKIKFSKLKRKDLTNLKE